MIEVSQKQNNWMGTVPLELVGSKAKISITHDRVGYHSKKAKLKYEIYLLKGKKQIDYTFLFSSGK